MIINYRFRLLPRKRQHRALERILELQRQLYNAALYERIDAYRKSGVTLSYFDQTRGLTEWRKSDHEACDVSVSVHRATLKRLDTAYGAFFRRCKSGGKAGFPRFRGKGRFDSFAFSQLDAIQITKDCLRFKGMPGSLRIHWHRALPVAAPIRSCTLKRDIKGWNVCFGVEIQATPLRKANRVVGVDVGISTFATLSDGGFVPTLRAARKAERKLRLLQRALTRKKRGGRGYQRARTELRRCHAGVVRQRNEHLHQASARLVRDYDVVVIEGLNVKSLSNGILAKDVRDASWGKFISMLRYKAECAGARLIEVDPCGTSQECSRCGTRMLKQLHERTHTCIHCGLSIHRDLNAARNILNRAGVGPGLRNVADYGMRAGENLNSGPEVQHRSLWPN